MAEAGLIHSPMALGPRAWEGLQEDAQLIAMHRNTSWRTDTGLQLDSGAFLIGLISGPVAYLIFKSTLGGRPRGVAGMARPLVFWPVTR